MTTIRDDVEFLAGRLPHRAANTENERTAAEYIRDRLQELAPDSTIDDFYSINHFYQLAAIYYFDFMFVSLFALWSPWAGFGYGSAIFLMYMAEITGFPLMARLLPQYETQNVVSRLMCPQPRWHLTVVANYDTPKASVLTHPKRTPHLRWWHLALVISMVLVLISCVAEGMGVYGETGRDAALWIRWAGSTLLIGVAFVLLLAEGNAEHTHGANYNASGVAAIMALAERLSRAPLQTADVTIVATGAKEMWLSGMQHYMRDGEFDKARSCFIQIASVGAGDLHFVTGEGMLQTFRSAPDLLEVARAHADTFDARSLRYRGLPTDALAPLVRGYKTLSIMGADSSGLSERRGDPDDGVGAVDFEKIERAVDYAEAIVRALDAKPPV